MSQPHLDGINPGKPGRRHTPLQRTAVAETVAAIRAAGMLERIDTAVVRLAQGTAEDYDAAVANPEVTAHTPARAADAHGTALDRLDKLRKGADDDDLYAEQLAALHATPRNPPPS